MRVKGDDAHRRCSADAGNYASAFLMEHPRSSQDPLRWGLPVSFCNKRVDAPRAGSIPVLELALQRCEDAKSVPDPGLPPHPQFLAPAVGPSQHGCLLCRLVLQGVPQSTGPVRPIAPTFKPPERVIPPQVPCPLPCAGKGLRVGSELPLGDWTKPISRPSHQSQPWQELGVLTAGHEQSPGGRGRQPSQWVGGADRFTEATSLLCRGWG